MTKCNEVDINNHKTTQHSHCNLAVHEIFSDILIHLIFMENAQSLRGTQLSKREESNSDNRKTVITELRVEHRGYFVKREELGGVGIRETAFVSKGYHNKLPETGLFITEMNYPMVLESRSLKSMCQ